MPPAGLTRVARLALGLSLTASAVAAQGKDTLRVAVPKPKPAAPVAAAPAPKPAPPTAVPGRTVVTSVTMGLIYLGAGRTDGIREGTVVTIPKLGPQAVYRVAFLSSKSAAARGDSLAPQPAIGDTATFEPVKDVVAEAGSQSRTRSGSTRRTGPRLRGRIGLRYLGSWDRGNEVTLKQPGLEVLLDGPVAPGAPVGLNVDIRSRRTSTYRPDAETATQGVMGVYQAAVRIQSPKGPFRAVFGRQYAPTLAGVGLFDGLLLDFQKARWGTGVMAGLAPELGTLAVSSEIRQLGVYFQGRSALQSPVRWNISFGGMGSYVDTEVNREFAFVQANLSSPVFNLFALQEIDYNRGWKVAAGEPRISMTSAYVSGYLTPVRGISLTGGFDSRRNVRLYRDLTTPETVFDDRFRRGYWGGANLNIGGKLRLGGDVRTRTVEGLDSLATTAYSATANLDRITPAGLGLRFRGTWYDTPDRGNGTLLVGAFRIAPANTGALEFNAGSRKETGNPDADRFWAGAEADLFIHRSWFVLATFTREWGRSGLTPTTDLLYAGLSYRF